MPSQLLNFSHCYWHGWRGLWKINISTRSSRAATNLPIPVSYRRESHLPDGGSFGCFPASFAEHSTRMFQAKQIVAVLIVACLASTGEAATRLERPSAAEKVTIQPRGRAYLFRGFIGVLDWGMDELARRINLTGVTATVNSYLVWRGVADQAISDYRGDPEPIAIIGHSLGGDAAVAFAERLAAVGVPVSLLVTYDPTRFSSNLPPNVERYINLYRSHSVLGGGDVVQGRDFHGHYASFDLKDRPGVYHTNMEKLGDIQDQLVSKIAALAATPASGEGDAVPLRIDIPSTASIELWDSGLPVTVRAGDTLQSLQRRTMCRSGR